MLTFPWGRANGRGEREEKKGGEKGGEVGEALAFF